MKRIIKSFPAFCNYVRPVMLYGYLLEHSKNTALSGLRELYAVRVDGMGWIISHRFLQLLEHLWCWQIIWGGHEDTDAVFLKIMANCHSSWERICFKELPVLIDDNDSNDWRAQFEASMIQASMTTTTILTCTAMCCDQISDGNLDDLK